MSLSIRENTFLNPGGIGRKILDILSPRTEAGRASIIGAELGLSPNDPSLAIDALSGGNQQKVVIGRWLATNRTLLICEDPTAGVDVGAKAEIYKLLRNLANDGKAILVLSRETVELIGLCDRIYVVHDETIVAEMPAAEATEHKILEAALSQSSNGSQ